MARKTIIRNDRPHEVKVGNDPHLAQSPKSAPKADVAIPASIRKSASAATGAATRKPTEANAEPKRSTAARKKARPAPREEAPAPAVRKRAAAVPRTPAPPKLPARVPADRLWEDDSAILQRLGALQEQNARLAEQLQRLQSPARLKGFQP